jgi:carbonic anhydrase
MVYTETPIVTCADPRLAPEKFLDLGPGTSCHSSPSHHILYLKVGPIFIRNVCGHVTPALNDIVALDRLVTIDNLLIIHHTGTWKNASNLIATTDMLSMKIVAHSLSKTRKSEQILRNESQKKARKSRV